MKLSIRKAKDGYRWRLRARNGRIQAESGEAYKTDAKCQKALGQVAAGFAAAHDRFKT